jgi:hypothetical protein
MLLECHAQVTIHFYSGGSLDYSVLLSAMRLALRLSTPKHNQSTPVLERPKRTPKIKVLTRELLKYITD